MASCDQATPLLRLLRSGRACIQPRRNFEASRSFPSTKSFLSRGSTRSTQSCRCMSSPNFLRPFLGARSLQLYGVSKRHSGQPKAYATGVTVRAGLPVISSVPLVGPLANFLFSPPILLAAYIVGAVRFWRGFPQTTYKDSLQTKLPLAALWPALLVASPGFRTNFKKAVQ